MLAHVGSAAAGCGPCFTTILVCHCYKITHAACEFLWCESRKRWRYWCLKLLTAVNVNFLCLSCLFVFLSLSFSVFSDYLWFLSVWWALLSIWLIDNWLIESLEQGLMTKWIDVGESDVCSFFTCYHAADASDLSFCVMKEVVLKNKVYSLPCECDS